MTSETLRTQLNSELLKLLNTQWKVYTQVIFYSLTLLMAFRLNNFTVVEKVFLRSMLNSISIILSQGHWTVPFEPVSRHSTIEDRASIFLEATQFEP